MVLKPRKLLIVRSKDCNDENLFLIRFFAVADRRVFSRASKWKILNIIYVDNQELINANMRISNFICSYKNTLEIFHELCTKKERCLRHRGERAKDLSPFQLGWWSTACSPISAWIWAEISFYLQKTKVKKYYNNSENSQELFFFTFTMSWYCLAISSKWGSTPWYSRRRAA